MLRLFPWLLLIASLAIVPWQAARTQPQPPFQDAAPQATPPQPSPPQPSPPPAPSPFGTLSPEQARAALDTLNDPKKRPPFAATLEALVKHQPAPQTPPIAASAGPPTDPAAQPSAAQPSKESIEIQLAPNSLGAQVLLTASGFLKSAADGLPRALRTMQSLPLLWGWVVVMITNPLGQQLLANAGWRLAVALAIALGVAQALRILLRRPMAAVWARAQPPPPSDAEEEDDPVARAERGAIEPPPRSHDRNGAGSRIGLALARFALRMTPVLGFFIAGHTALATGLGGTQGSRLVIIAVLDAIAGSQALL